MRSGKEFPLHNQVTYSLYALYVLKLTLALSISYITLYL